MVEKARIIIKMALGKSDAIFIAMQWYTWAAYFKWFKIKGYCEKKIIIFHDVACVVVGWIVAT